MELICFVIYEGPPIRCAVPWSLHPSHGYRLRFYPYTVLIIDTHKKFLLAILDFIKPRIHETQFQPSPSMEPKDGDWRHNSPGSPTTFIPPQIRGSCLSSAQPGGAESLLRNAHEDCLQSARPSPNSRSESCRSDYYCSQHCPKRAFRLNFCH